MCGISGIYSPNSFAIQPATIRKMLTQIRYRGPDESGIYIGAGIGMGSVRLSIIDLLRGQQPMSDPEGDLWIVYNGEIFNYVELRQELTGLGYRFRTGSDTEVLLMLYKQYREGCLEKLNGQFAFAIWDSKSRELFLARDRIGIRPLYYFHHNGDFVFASEIKSIMESGCVTAELDPTALNQLFTFWTIPSPGTMFQGVYELPPGYFLRIGPGQFTLEPYWELGFTSRETPFSTGGFQDAVEEFDSLITDAVRLRLRSDVQVAAYLSGGIDSSATTYYIKKVEPGLLNTFSLGFEQREYDETSFQQQVSRWLNTSHHAVVSRDQDIASHFAQVLWHTETPLLRTGAVPMFQLSNLVYEHGIKVVITGEGADELLGGYNIFKEALIREFWSRQPESRIRPLLLQKLYPYLAQFQGRNRNLLKFFFGYGLQETSSPFYSHLVRWNNSNHIKEHFTRELRDASRHDPLESLTGMLPPGFEKLDLLSRAQWIESKLFLSGYLLSSQGDRMAMAHSVEGRYPFLDHRVIEFCTRLPSSYKIRGLNEKYLLKKLMTGRLPGEVVNRPKQAYRAPVASSLVAGNTPGYLREMLSPGQLKKHGLFKPDTVEKLLGRPGSGSRVTENDNMAIAGILSTQILLDLFVSGNNPFRETRLRMACPVRYDKTIKVTK